MDARTLFAPPVVIKRLVIAHARKASGLPGSAMFPTRTMPTFASGRRAWRPPVPRCGRSNAAASTLSVQVMLARMPLTVASLTNIGNDWADRNGGHGPELQVKRREKSKANWDLPLFRLNARRYCGPLAKAGSTVPSGPSCKLDLAEFYRES